MIYKEGRYRIVVAKGLWIRNQWLWRVYYNEEIIGEDYRIGAISHARALNVARDCIIDHKNALASLRKVAAS